jgi:hypothetical protein
MILCFGMHSLGKNQATTLTYHEAAERKGANNVTSMLFIYLKSIK